MKCKWKKTLKLQNEYEQAVLSENIWSGAELITQQREALTQILISRPAEYMAPKEEKSSRSVLPGHLATGDTKEDLWLRSRQDLILIPHTSIDLAWSLHG